jgi:hypothetical protein
MVVLQLVHLCRCLVVAVLARDDASKLHRPDGPLQCDRDSMQWRLGWEGSGHGICRGAWYAHSAAHGEAGGKVLLYGRARWRRTTRFARRRRARQSRSRIFANLNYLIARIFGHESSLIWPFKHHTNLIQPFESTLIYMINII